MRDLFLNSIYIYNYSKKNIKKEYLFNLTMIRNGFASDSMQDLGIAFIECSAKDATNVEAAFQLMSTELIAKSEKQGARPRPQGGTVTGLLQPKHGWKFIQNWMKRIYKKKNDMKLTQIT